MLIWGLNHSRVRDHPANEVTRWSLVLQDTKSVLFPDSTLKLTFKKLPVAAFRFSVRDEYFQFSERAVDIYLPFQMLICTSPSFLLGLEQKQHVGAA